MVDWCRDSCNWRRDWFILELNEKEGGWEEGGKWINRLEGKERKRKGKERKREKK